MGFFSKFLKRRKKEAPPPEALPVLPSAIEEHGETTKTYQTISKEIDRATEAKKTTRSLVQTLLDKLPKKES